MLFMVIEHFRDGGPERVAQRFRAMGRLIPEHSGVEYVDSWMTQDGSGCYQLMRAPSRGSLDLWLAAWDDLVRFEVIEVEASRQWWARREV